LDFCDPQLKVNAATAQFGFECAQVVELQRAVRASAAATAMADDSDCTSVSHLEGDRNKTMLSWRQPTCERYMRM
jgi:hypothetical protein